MLVYSSANPAISEKSGKPKILRLLKFGDVVSKFLSLGCHLDDSLLDFPSN